MKAFDCRLCGECCYGEGGIFLAAGEAERIAAFLGMDVRRFLREHCREGHGRSYVGTGPDGFCCFYDQERRCLIHPVKPGCCSLWPFFPAIVADRDNWELTKEACPGINPDCPFEEFVRQSKT